MRHRIGIASAALAVAACSDAAGSGPEPPGTAAAAGTASAGSGAGGAAAGSAGAGAAAGSGGLVEAGASDSGDGKIGCSADLRSVIDGAGNVIEACGDDQGCSGGACVPACQAAADAAGSVGCDFVVPTPSFHPLLAPPCHAVFVANNWPKDARIAVTRNGTSYDASLFGRMPDGTPNAAAWPAVPATGVPPNGVAVLFLSSDPASVSIGGSLACPVKPAIDAGTAIPGSGRSAAWHVTADLPVSAYDILPYGGAKSFLPSAQLLLPTSAWGTNYVAVVPRKGNLNPFADSIKLHWLQVVAFEDGTTVDVAPTLPLPGGTDVAPAPAGAVTQYQLTAGEVLQFHDTKDVSGSVLSSSRPVAVVGGISYHCLESQTTSGGGCDAAHQMVPPVSALGDEYVGAPFASRRAGGLDESIPYRLVGAVDGTALSFDPPVAGAPATLGRGQIADFEAVGAFVVRSQDATQPFYLAQMMTGCEVLDKPSGLFAPCPGDEDFVNVLPPAQYLGKYVFFTDPSYATTNLTLVRRRHGGAFADVFVDCLGTLSGWKPIGAADFEYTNVHLVSNGVPVGSCSNGLHVAGSDGPFGVMVWGLDDAASYGYPAGGNVARINDVWVPPNPR